MRNAELVVLVDRARQCSRLTTGPAHDEHSFPFLVFFYFLPLILTTHARLLEFARTSKRERYPSHERTGLLFSCFFFLLSLGHLYTCMRVKNGEERK